MGVVNNVDEVQQHSRDLTAHELGDAEGKAEDKVGNEDSDHGSGGVVDDLQRGSRLDFVQPLPVASHLKTNKKTFEKNR